jgi:hypothetical protein
MRKNRPMPKQGRTSSPRDFPMKSAILVVDVVRKAQGLPQPTSMAGEAVGMANVVCGVMQHGGIGKAGTENQEAADQQGENSGRDAVVERKRNA